MRAGKNWTIWLSPTFRSIFHCLKPGSSIHYLTPQYIFHYIYLYYNVATSRQIYHGKNVTLDNLIGQGGANLSKTLRGWWIEPVNGKSRFWRGGSWIRFYSTEPAEWRSKLKRPLVEQDWFLEQLIGRIGPGWVDREIIVWRGTLSRECVRVWCMCGCQKSLWLTLAAPARRVNKAFS